MDDTVIDLDEIAIRHGTNSEEPRRAALRNADRTEFPDVMGSVERALPDALFIADENDEVILANVQADLIFFGYHGKRLSGQPAETAPQSFQHDYVAYRLGCQLET